MILTILILSFTAGYVTGVFIMKHIQKKDALQEDWEIWR